MANVTICFFARFKLFKTSAEIPINRSSLNWKFSNVLNVFFPMYLNIKLAYKEPCKIKSLFLHFHWHISTLVLCQFLMIMQVRRSSCWLRSIWMTMGCTSTMRVQRNNFLVCLISYFHDNFFSLVDEELFSGWFCIEFDTLLCVYIFIGDLFLCGV